MASQFAILLAAPSADEDDTPNDDAVAWCDSKLQEVREVLAELIREHDDPMSDYGCTTHTTQRARALYEKLEVK